MGWFLVKPIPFPGKSEASVDAAGPVQDWLETEYQSQLLERSLRMSSDRAALLSSWAKVLLIVLGALTATKAVADDLIGAESAGVVLSYTVIGVAVATLAGLLAAFKWEEKAAQLIVLTTRTTAWRREKRAEAHYRAGRLREIDPNKDPDFEEHRAQAFGELVEFVAAANNELEAFEVEAGKLGVRIEQPLEDRQASSEADA